MSIHNHDNGSPAHCWHPSGDEVIEVDHGKFGTTLIKVAMQECCACGQRVAIPKQTYKADKRTKDYFPS